MKITEKIIEDLLPLYWDGEASTDTVALIETYFKEHPDFAAGLQKRDGKNPLVDIPIPLKQEDEMKILDKTKKMFRLRSLLMALAILTTALPFSVWDVSFDDVEGVNSLWNAAPEAAVFSALIALASWTGYWLLNRRLDATGI